MGGRMVMAIDPGYTGAIALYNEDRQSLDLTDMPVLKTKTGKTRLDFDKLVSLLELSAVFANVCVIEAVSSMPGQGGVPMFNFGVCYGALLGIAATFSDTPVVTVPAAQWKAGAGLVAPKGATRAQRKNISRARAIEVFPGYAEKFARVKDDGRAEAALLAHWYALSGRTP